MDSPRALDSSRCLVHLVAGMDGGKRSVQSLALNPINLRRRKVQSTAKIQCVRSSGSYGDFHIPALSVSDGVVPNH